MRLLSTRKLSKGFTLIELLVVAPVAIITIATLISLMVALVGDIAVSRERSVSSYDVQNALDRIEQDARLATSYLAALNTITAPQGKNNSTSVFSTASGDLILSQYATSSDPYNDTRKLIYYADQPYACGATYTLNRPMTYRIVYFTKVTSGVTSLWRRVIVPPGSTSAMDETKLCDNPWQRNSCTESYISTGRCVTRDEKLVDYVSSFTTTYYLSGGGTTTDARNATSLKVSIEQTKSVSGEPIITSGVARVFHVNAAADENPTAVDVSVLNPAVNTFNNPVRTTFTWDKSVAASIYSVRYRLNGGSWVTAPNQTSNQYLLNTARPNDTIEIGVTAKNDFGSSSEVIFYYTKPLWTVANLAGNWYCYDIWQTIHSCPKYTLTEGGLLLMTGLAASAGPTTPIFTLPAGVRPNQRQMFPTVANDSLGRVDVATNGTVTYESGTGTSFVSMDSIQFIPSGTPGVTWSNATINTANGWSNSTLSLGAYGYPRYTKDLAGRVVIAGLLDGSSATLTSGATMITFPSTFRPPATLILPGVSSPGNYFPMQVTGSNTVATRGIGAANSWNSIGAIYYPSGSLVTQNPLPLTSPWAHYASFNSPAYAKGTDNVVSLRGVIRLGSTARYTTIATLPPGFRPGVVHAMTTAGVSTAGGTAGQIAVRLDINPNGAITIMNLASDNLASTYLSLEGIHFYQEN